MDGRQQGLARDHPPAGAPRPAQDHLRDPGGGALARDHRHRSSRSCCARSSRVPIAVLVGIYLVEYGRGPLARVTTFMVDILTGIPSIVAALFIYAVFVTTFRGQRAGWLVSLALVMLMIPVIVRTTEEMLKLVPNELREASYALGVPKWKTIVRIVLPTAMTGIITGIVLGIARVAGETAPLLILVGYTQDTNGDLFSGFQGSLPGMINDQVGNLGKHARTPARKGRHHPLRRGPDVGRGAHPDHHRHGPEPDRPPDRAVQQGQPTNGTAQTHGQAHRRQEPQHLLRQVPRRQRLQLHDRAAQRHRVHRPVRLRQVDRAAHPQPDARGDRRRARRGRGAARRRQHLRRRGRPGRRPAHDRHGVPAAEPVPDHVDLRQRRRRAEAAERPDEQRPSSTTSSRSRCAARTSGKRSRTASTSQAPACPVASSSGCASPARSRSSRRCC